MFKFISSDSIIGNFVIEAVAKKDFQIEITKLFDFDKQLSNSLRQYNYYTRFECVKVWDFHENYPFFVKSVDDQYINIINDLPNMESFQASLIRHFRIGMPKIVVDEIKLISQNILG